MGYLVVKVLISAVIIVAASEIAERSTLLGGLVASLPLTSLLAMIWFYRDTGDVERVAQLATSILWLIVPSLSLFILLPILLRRGIQFYPALGASILATSVAYVLTLGIARRLGS